MSTKKSKTRRNPHPFSKSSLTSFEAASYASEKMQALGIDVTINQTDGSIGEAFWYIDMSRIAIKNLGEAKALADALIRWYLRD